MRVGLIGLGNIGYPLFQNLLKNKYYVNVLLESKNTDFIHQYNTYHINQIDKFIKNSDKIISVIPESNLELDTLNEITLNEITLNEITLNEIKPKYWINLGYNIPKNVNEKLKFKNIEFLNSEIIGDSDDIKNGHISTNVSGSKLAYHNCQDLINIYANHINYVSSNISIK